MAGFTTSMMRAIALDDEPLALRVIEQFAKKAEHLELLQTFTNPDEVQLFLESNSVDLIFLDIHMPKISGLEFMKRLPEEVMVIFTTAFANYAVEGFNVNALDYLLKPFTFDRFAQALEKAHNYQHLLENASSQKPESPIHIRADFKDHKVMPSEITLIEGLDDYLRLHRKDAKTLVSRMTMKSIIKMLPEGQFMRVHRSYILPLNRIKALKGKVIFLDDGSEIPLGNTYNKAFMEVWKNLGSIS